MSQADHIIECAARLARKRMDGPDTPTPPSKRKHPKRHATGWRKSLEQKRKNKRAKRAIEENEQLRRHNRDVVSRYYRGELDDLSRLR